MSEENTDQPEIDESSANSESSVAEPVTEPAFPLHRIVESILFASQKPVSAKELSNFLKGAAEAAKENPEITCFAKVKSAQLQDAIEQLEREYAETGRAFEVRESAAGWQLVTKADFAPWLRQLFPENRQARLSAPAMETLAIIAYRQPIKRADIDALRGSDSSGSLRQLARMGLILGEGSRETTYRTTPAFLKLFSIDRLEDLPRPVDLEKQ